MLIPKVKICGLTNYEDAKAAVDMGADLLGLNFYSESPRYLTPEKAAKIVSKLPAFIDIVGLFVNSSFEEIREVMEHVSMDWVQIHGDEPPEFLLDFLTVNVKTIKAIRVKGEEDIDKMEDYRTDAVLFDAFAPDQYGGTGLSFDWKLIENTDRRIFLAGGITPENAIDAIKIGVYGIDICSGVEKEPGIKDHEKMKKLFENISHLRA